MFMIEIIKTEANYSGDHVWSWLLLVRNVTVVTGGLLKLKAQDHIHTSNSFLRQWKTEHPPSSTDWHQDYHGRLGAERSQLWELGWFPELVLEEVCLTCLVLSPH